MRRNYDARKIVLEGCVDSTSLAPIERVRALTDQTHTHPSAHAFT